MSHAVWWQVAISCPLKTWHPYNRGEAIAAPDLHLTWNFHSFRPVSCFHFSSPLPLISKNPPCSRSFIQCCIVHPPPYILLSLSTSAITSLHLFSPYNVVCPLPELLCFTLCFPLHMYASPLASFTLYIYNAVYECPFACTDFPPPLLLSGMYAPPSFYIHI